MQSICGDHFPFHIQIRKHFLEGRYLIVFFLNRFLLQNDPITCNVSTENLQGTLRVWGFRCATDCFPIYSNNFSFTSKSFAQDIYIAFPTSFPLSLRQDFVYHYSLFVRRAWILERKPLTFRVGWAIIILNAGLARLRLGTCRSFFIIQPSDLIASAFWAKPRVRLHFFLPGCIPLALCPFHGESLDFSSDFLPLVHRFLFFLACKYGIIP
jgi:hypothetical protein